jgi:hypothetical protein
MNLADMTTAELTALVQGREARRTSAANLALWTELYARLPGDEGVAVGYADQLWGAEAVEALDRLLPSLLQRFPASVPLRYFWVRLPMIWGKPEEAARRCNIVMPKTPTDPNWVLVAYRLSLILGQYGQARRIAETARPNTGIAFYDWLAKSAGQYEIAAAAAAGQTAAQDYAVLFINLDGETRRRHRIETHLAAHGLVGQRVAGVPGGTLPDGVCRMLTKGGGDRMKGTLGCFLSHVGAWEMCARGDKPYALVLEDDAGFVVRPPPTVASLRVPGDHFDLCFVNEGMNSAAVALAPDAAPQAIAVDDVLAQFPPVFEAPGADGYFLSRDGARRLLDFVAEDGLAGDVDWRLLLYAASDEVREGQTPQGFAARALGLHQRYRRSSGRISAYVAVPPLIFNYHGGSTRDRVNFLASSHDA